MSIHRKIKRNHKREESRKSNNTGPVLCHSKVRYLHEIEIHHLLTEFYEKCFDYIEFDPDSEIWSILKPHFVNGKLEWEREDFSCSCFITHTIKTLIYEHFQMFVVGCQEEEEVQCVIGRLTRCLKNEDFLFYIVELVKETFYSQDFDDSKLDEAIIILPMKWFGLSNSMPTVEENVAVA